VVEHVVIFVKVLAEFGLVGSPWHPLS